MKNKKTIWIAVAIAVVALVVIALALKPSDTVTKDDDPAVKVEDNVQTSAPVTDASPATSEEAFTESENVEEEEGSVAQLIENEGDIEIIIPDDQASDGF